MVWGFEIMDRQRDDMVDVPAIMPVCRPTHSVSEPRLQMSHQVVERVPEQFERFAASLRAVPDGPINIGRDGVREASAQRGALACVRSPLFRPQVIPVFVALQSALRPSLPSGLA